MQLILVMVIITTTIITTTTANAAEQTEAASSSPKALFEVAQSSDLFGYKLLHQLELQERSQRGENGGNDPQNLLISPFSLSTVLTMAMTGAQGDTYEEMRSVLGLDTSKSEPEKPEQLISAYNSILQTLNSSSTNPSSSAVLQLANAVALQDHFPLLPTFLDVVESDFHSKLFSVDFARGGKAAIEKINSWAGEKTNGMIPELFAEELDPATKLVLLNALYFKGAWAKAFEEELTTEEEFTFSAEKKKFNVSMMHIESNGLQAGICQEGHLVELPYKGGGRQSMLLFLPNETLLENSTISSTFLQTAILDNSETHMRRLPMKVDLALPRFKLESSVQLKEPLRKMGMRAAFEGGVDGADFSRMTGNRMLKIAQVVQKTMIEVNEAGAEAAAASAVQMIYYSGKVSLPTIALHFNRPFLFAIRDNRLQVNLFVGIVNKPEGGGGEVVKKVEAGEAKQKVSPVESSKEEEEHAENDNEISIDEILQLLEGREQMYY